MSEYQPPEFQKTVFAAVMQSLAESGEFSPSQREALAHAMEAAAFVAYSNALAGETAFEKHRAERESFGEETPHGADSTP